MVFSYHIDRTRKEGKKSGTYGGGVARERRRRRVDGGEGTRTPERTSTGAAGGWHLKVGRWRGWAELKVRDGKAVADQILDVDGVVANPNLLGTPCS